MPDTALFVQEPAAHVRLQIQTHTMADFEEETDFAEKEDTDAPIEVDVTPKAKIKKTETIKEEK